MVIGYGLVGIEGVSREKLKSTVNGQKKAVT